MKTRTTCLLAAATLAGVLLTTASCAVPQAGTQPTAPTPAATTAAPESSPTATAAATSPAAVATETASPAPAPETPQAAALKTFTFPDGHISFTHPAGWTVTVKPGPALNAEDQKTSFDATISDESGTELARMYSGMYGDGAAGPAKRTLLDHSPVAGITDKTGEATEFGFAYDEYLDGRYYYFMDVRNASEFLAHDGSSGSNQILLPNGVLGAWVLLSDAPSTLAFASPAAAKNWMETRQYAQLKAMLLSLKYS